MCTNPCPEKCRLNKVHKNLFLLNSTPYLCFNLVWRETNPKLTDICILFFMLPLKFRNQDLFELADNQINKAYELTGLVCYWGSHYISFFKSEDNDNSYWVSYDDTIITKITSWKELIIKCIRSHFHPTILFYRRIEGESAYSSMGDIKENISDEELRRIMSYCVNYDKENQSTYKNEEADSNRLRPTSNDKKKSDEDVTQSLKKMRSSVNNFDHLKSNYNNEEDKYEINNENKITDINENINFNGQNQIENISNDIRLNMNKINSLNNNTYPSSYNIKNDVMPNLNEDEWICEYQNCQNINKISEYLCFSKIYLLIL